MNDKDQQKLLNLVLAVLALWVVWKLVNHTHDKVILEGQDPDEDFEGEAEDEFEETEFEEEEEEGDEGEGYGNYVEPYSESVGGGFADLYEGQDNKKDKKHEKHKKSDDTCLPFMNISDCKDIKGKSRGVKKLRKHCKKCMK